IRFAHHGWNDECRHHGDESHRDDGLDESKAAPLQAAHQTMGDARKYATTMPLVGLSKRKRPVAFEPSAAFASSGPSIIWLIVAACIDVSPLIRMATKSVLVAENTAAAGPPDTSPLLSSASYRSATLRLNPVYP